jgi:hypothetical protein
MGSQTGPKRGMMMGFSLAIHWDFSSVKVNHRRAKNVISVWVTSIFSYILGRPVLVVAFRVYATLNGAYIFSIVLVSKTSINGVVCCHGGGGGPRCGEQKQTKTFELYTGHKIVKRPAEAIHCQFTIN